MPSWWCSKNFFPGCWKMIYKPIICHSRINHPNSLHLVEACRPTMPHTVHASLAPRVLIISQNLEAMQVNNLFFSSFFILWFLKFRLIITTKYKFWGTFQYKNSVCIVKSDVDTRSQSWHLCLFLWQYGDQISLLPIS